MQFKDIKQGYPVYILDKSNLNFSQGKTTAVSFSRMDVNQKTGKAEMVRGIRYTKKSRKQRKGSAR